MCRGGGVGFVGLKGIKVTRCNRMALRVYVGVCVCWSQRGQELLLWLSSFNSVNLHEVFSLCPDMLILSLFLLPSVFLYLPLTRFTFPLSLCFDTEQQHLFTALCLCGVTILKQPPVTSHPPFSMKVSVLGYKMWTSCNHTLENTTMCLS